jgi:hypothetical protein
MNDRERGGRKMKERWSERERERFKIPRGEVDR